MLPCHHGRMPDHGLPRLRGGGELQLGRGEPRGKQRSSGSQDIYIRATVAGTSHIADAVSQSALHTTSKSGERFAHRSFEERDLR
jgi:hypothetical protein